MDSRIQNQRIGYEYQQYAQCERSISFFMDSHFVGILMRNYEFVMK